MKKMLLCALFAALSAVLAQIAIPIGPVPITLTLLSVFMAGGLLGTRDGAISQTVYVALGAVGVPVFAGLKGGLGALLGPTGGFIFGYIACAFIVGLIAERFGRTIKVLPLAMIAGTVATYLPGLLWYMYSVGSAFVPALSVCVLPFIPGEALKIVLATILVSRLHPVVNK